MPFEFTDEQVKNYHQSTTDLIDYLQKSVDPQFFNGAQSILDVGCGDGKMTACIATLSPTSLVVGCDVSPSMIAFASKQYPSDQYPNLRFLEKNICHLDFHQEFERVISFNCLHWIKNQKSALDSLYASLKLGGKAFIVACPKSSEDDLQTICRKIIVSWRWLPYFLTFKTEHSFHSLKEYENLLKGAQFSIENIRQIKRETIFDDQKALNIFLTSILTPLYHLREEKRATFLNDLFSELKKRGNVDAKGKIHLFISQIEMLVSKKG